jgi:hypothetical protein
MAQPTDTEIAWAAGLFEGEGCIVFQKQKRGRGTCTCIRLELKMCDEDVVRRFADIVGAKVVGPYEQATAGWKPYWDCRIGKISEVRHILDLFGPYLGKRRQARVREVMDLYAKRFD